MNYTKLLSAIFLFIIMATASAAMAQLPNRSYSDTPFSLDEDGIPYSNKYWKGQPSSNVISLVRKPELAQGQFILRFTNPYIMNGCVDISNYGFSAEYRDIYLDIEIEGQTVDMRDQPQYSHFQCDRSSKQPKADVVLNKADLVQNETKQIRMHNGADTNYYNVEITDEMVRIMPDTGDATRSKRFKPHNIPGRKTSLTYWFYPENTLVLWVPESKDNPEIAKKLQSFAKTKGLEPLENIYTSFESPLTDTQYRYFVDSNGRFANDKDLQQGSVIGKIPVQKLVYGLEKDEYELDEVMVYAKRPGMYE